MPPPLQPQGDIFWNTYDYEQGHSTIQSAMDEVEVGEIAEIDQAAILGTFYATRDSDNNIHCFETLEEAEDFLATMNQAEL